MDPRPSCARRRKAIFFLRPQLMPCGTHKATSATAGPRNPHHFNFTMAGPDRRCAARRRHQGAPPHFWSSAFAICAVTCCGTQSQTRRYNTSASSLCVLHACTLVSRSKCVASGDGMCRVLEPGAVTSITTVRSPDPVADGWAGRAGRKAESSAMQFRHSNLHPKKLHTSAHMLS